MSQTEPGSVQNGQVNGTLIDTKDESPWKANTKTCLRYLYKALSSPVGLVLLLLGYTFIGAAIFRAIEEPEEQARRQQVVTTRANVTESFQSLLILTGVQYNRSNWTALINEQLKAYEAALLHKHGINTESTGHVWDFWGAFLFSATIYTTIGYGHIAPSGYKGQVATMLYAILGIPLCLIVMANLGKLFTRGIKWLWARIPGRRCKKVGTLVIQNDTINQNPLSSEQSGQDHTDGAPAFVVDGDFNLPPLVAIVIVVVYIAIGAALYGLWENWTYLEAFYFIFISISTIGFGDILPEHPRYFLASSLYVLFGLSLVAMVVTVIMEAVTETLNKAKNTIEDKVAQAISMRDLKTSYKLNSKSGSKESV